MYIYNVYIYNIHIADAASVFPSPYLQLRYQQIQLKHANTFCNTEVWQCIV